MMTRYVGSNLKRCRHTPTDTHKSPPRKTIRARRKKNRPLADLSTNVPRLTNGRVSRDSSTSSGLSSKPLMRPTPYMAGMVETLIGPFRQPIDVFRDEGPKHGTSYLFFEKSVHLSAL